jgi:pyruvate ferredoxin oxidoreductase beta subunit
MPSARTHPPGGPPGEAATVCVPDAALRSRSVRSCSPPARPGRRGCATSCLEVSTSIYPYSSWKTPFIHSAFENSAARSPASRRPSTALKRAGKIPADKKVKFVAFGGDGGTYDIGLQSLSGAMERGHDMVYVCYDNGAYMNTGIQRSSATPLRGLGDHRRGRQGPAGQAQRRKDLTSIIAAHGVPYVAQGSISHWKDLTSKAEKAFAVDGPAFLNVLATCPRGWRSRVQQVDRTREAWRADRLLAALRGRVR